MLYIKYIKFYKNLFFYKIMLDKQTHDQNHFFIIFLLPAYTRTGHPGDARPLVLGPALARITHTIGARALVPASAGGVRRDGVQRTGGR